jgi:hypothetical protein
LYNALHIREDQHLLSISGSSSSFNSLGHIQLSKYPVSEMSTPIYTRKWRFRAGHGVSVIAVIPALGKLM